MHNTRDSFGSKFGAIAALAGSAVGLGNIWKFPYEAGNNGGGAFLLVYVFFTIAIGLPVMALGIRPRQIFRSERFRDIRSVGTENSLALFRDSRVAGCHDDSFLLRHGCRVDVGIRGEITLVFVSCRFRGELKRPV